MAFQVVIPRAPSGSPYNLLIDEGRPLYILGANGSGKSSLLLDIYISHRSTALRIAAHRQNFFDSEEISLTAQSRQNVAVNIRDQDFHPSSRWRMDYVAQRLQAPIFDLIAAENLRARTIAAAVSSGSVAEAQKLAASPSPVTTINELFQLAGLAVRLRIDADQVLRVTRDGSATVYGIPMMSDGERSALVLAATILTAAKGTLLIVDEPERHLHRSIIVPLLRELFARRTDCAFVVSTHDVGLPATAREPSQILLLRSGTTGTAYDFDLVEASVPVPDDLKADILGARRSILFVEGTFDSSLDLPLYRLVFPGVTIIPKGGCHEVEQAVRGIRSTTELHWIKAFGIVDGDRRSQENKERLKEGYVFAVPLLSVESIYYCETIQRRIAIRQAGVDNSDPEKRLAAAKEAALAKVTQNIDRLSRRTAEAAVREEYRRQTPGGDEIKALSPYAVVVYIPTIVAAERKRLSAALAANDFEMIVRSYPLRETSALGQIANKLGFQDRAHYEAAVTKLLLDDQAALAEVQVFFKDVIGALVA